LRSNPEGSSDWSEDSNRAALTEAVPLLKDEGDGRDIYAEI
jgi:hypothetical protein